MPVLVLGVAGVLGGVVWAWWATPASFLVTRAGPIMDEERLGELFAVEGRYAAVGVAGGFLVGLVLAALLHRVGWLLAVGAGLGGLAAAAAAYAVGVQLGPADPGTDPDVPRGTTVPAPFVVETYGLFGSWAVGATAGIVLMASLVDRTDGRSPDSAPSDPARG